MIPFEAPCAAVCAPPTRPSALFPVASVPPPPPPPKQRRSSIASGVGVAAVSSAHSFYVKVKADAGRAIRSSKVSLQLLRCRHAVFRCAVEVSACYGTALV